jgi:hypothetical protein
MSPASAVARVFTDDKVIDSRALNLAGVQLFRTLLARSCYALRRGWHHPMLDELTRTGIVVCENFLPEPEFAEWRNEASVCISSMSPKKRYRDGTTEVDHYALTDLETERFPHAARWPDQEQVVTLIAAAERRKLRRRDGVRVLEHVSLGDYSTPDEQTDLHIDTFFNTHKAWLYLDDVCAENAPLVYVPGSHKNDRVRLRHDYRESRSTNRGSRRVSEEEVSLRGLERRVVSCPRNTLVVVNTRGYHCRAVGDAGASRRAFHMSFRFNPFTLRG